MQFSEKTQTTPTRQDSAYFDVQAEMGHTKHIGGAQATRDLLEFCQISPDKHVLYVGCGAGASVVYIIKTYGCRVTAVDIHPKMVSVARERAQRLGVGDHVTFKVADAQDLPFEDNKFDILICESVNTFIPDLARAVSEYVRVVRPGGFVGWNEAVWVKEPPAELEAGMEELIGYQVRRSEEWEAALFGAGLEKVAAQVYEIDMRREAGNQFAVLGWEEYFRIIGRFIGSLFNNREARELYRQAIRSTPRAYADRMGYGLYVGRK